MSFQVFAPVSRRVTQTLTSLPTLPIQVNLVASNLAAAAAEQGFGRDAAVEEADYGAVARRGIEHLVGGGKTPGARPVDRNDGWISRDVLADMPRHRAHHGVIAAADAEADHHGNGMRFVELLDRLRHLLPSGRIPLSAMGALSAGQPLEPGGGSGDLGLAGHERRAPQHPGQTEEFLAGWRRRLRDQMLEPIETLSSFEGKKIGGAEWVGH